MVVTDGEKKTEGFDYKGIVSLGQVSYNGRATFDVVQVFANFNCYGGLFVCAMMYLTRGQLAARLAENEAREKSIFGVWKYLLVFRKFFFEALSFWYLLYAITAFLATYGYVFLLPLLMCDIVTASETLRDVIRAVTNPAKQLGLSALFGVIVLMFFTLLGITIFIKDGEGKEDGTNIASECLSLSKCVVYFLDYGFRSGGGIGDVMEVSSSEESWGVYHIGRFLYKFCFFILINVVLLNIVFGIIIDTFSALREEHNAKVLV